MKNYFLKNPVRAFTGFALFLSAPFLAITASAQGSFGAGVTQAPTTNITNVNDVFGLINGIFNILFWLLLALAAIFIIFAAFTYLTAGGDPEKVKKAGHRVIYAAVAVVIAVLAKAIPSVVCTFLANGCSNGPTGSP